ncbi:hypothetical protein ONT17_14305 [Prevotella copri]|uniref:hypothetical protein n=1 Tax=Segatella copri TaxID=165179 RepID=UPI00223027CB|nr:hypothetical protein [Segatella copri]MCW4119900.1 hypothetical protein [Segatella copri]
MGTVQVMALNPARKGNMGRLNSSQPLTVYDSLIAQNWLKGVIEQIRGEKPISGVDDGDGTAVKKAREALKKQLPIRAIHYYRFRNNHRSAEDADPESFLFQTTIDVDDMEYVDAALEKARELNCSNTIWKGKLLHLEYSARKKLHIDIRMPMGMTIEETQKAYCEAAGIPYDKSCITPERIIFITDKGSEIYRSKDWYAVLPAEELKARREAFLKRGLTIDGRGTARYSLLAGDCKSPERLVGDFQGQIPNDSNHKVPSSNLKVQSNHKVQCSKFNVQSEDNRLPGTSGDNAVSSGSAIQPAQSGDSNRVDDSHLSPAGDAQNAGRVAATEAGSASEKNLIAFDLFQESAGLKGMNIDTVGSRHSSLLAIMSAGASRVMSEEELMKVVAEKMPSYYKEPDCHQLIHDFYAKYGDSSKPFSRDVIRINATAEQAAKSLLAGDCKSPERLAGNHTVQSSMFQVQSNEDDDYPAPPPMPKKLPKLVELLISNTPEDYKAAVANAIFPPLATHLWKTRFNYIDNVEHEATLMCCLLAGTGAGKNCVQMPINLIMEDIRKRDQDNLKREKEWKEEMTRKGANKDKRKRPENLIIQEIDPDMTNPAFVMRTAEAQEHFLYASLNEVNQFDALKGQGGQQFVIMCLAFDPGNIYGQTRVGISSVTERVTIRFNWNASTTVIKGQRYFAKVLTDGPLSRINFCTIPEREIGAEMPVYGIYDDDFRAQLKPYIDNLCMASGLVDCPEAFELAKQLKDENADFARMSQDRVYENLSFRANVIGYLKACVLYVANGCKWEPEIADFIRWSERYDLYCKMRFFGEAIAKADYDGEKSSKRGPSNLLQLLPDTFNFTQVEALRLQYKKSKKGTKQMLSNWLFRKYIRKIEPAGVQDKTDFNFSNFSFEKLCFRQDGVKINVE